MNIKNFNQIIKYWKKIFKINSNKLKFNMKNTNNK